MVADDSLSQAVVLANSGVKVPQHNELVMGGHCLDGVVQLDVNSCFVFITRCEHRGVHSNQGGVSVLCKWYSDSHQTLTVSSWSEVVLVYELGANGKSYVMYA